MKSGFSVIEVILAVTLFAIFATGVTTTLLSGLNVNQTSGEYATASQFANEGLEAARSIKNQGFNNLSSLLCEEGTGVLQNANGVWEFSGTNNTFDKYTRVIYVCDVHRDSLDNIILTGTPDPEAKRIISKVTWNINPARTTSIVQSTYLTNWAQTAQSSSGGLLIYGESSNPLKYRTYDGGTSTFGTQTNFPSGVSGYGLSYKKNPTKSEGILTLYYQNNVIVWCHNGESWNLEWTDTISANLATEPINIGFENSSGDALVLYTASSGGNALKYRTKPGTTGCGGSNWTAASAFPSSPVLTTNLVSWVKLESDTRSGTNRIGAAWADDARNLGAAIWNGTSWESFPNGPLTSNLERVRNSSYQDIDSFDLAFESLSGDLMVVWGDQSGTNGTNGVRYVTCETTLNPCIWSGVNTPPTFADDATHLDISPNPLDNQILFASAGNAGNDLQVGRWDGTNWDNVSNMDTSVASITVARKTVATGWITSPSVRGIVVFNNQQQNGLIHYYVMTPGSPPVWSGSPETPFTYTAVPALGSPRTWTELYANPNNPSELILCVSDSTGYLFVKSLEFDGSNYTWTALDGNSSMGTVNTVASSQFSFAFW